MKKKGKKIQEIPLIVSEFGEFPFWFPELELEGFSYISPLTSPQCSFLGEHADFWPGHSRGGKTWQTQSWLSGTSTSGVLPPSAFLYLLLRVLKQLLMHSVQVL